MTKKFIHLMSALALLMPAFGGTPLTDEQKEWLRKVNPLITLKERKVFRKRRHTEQERKEFIELFWAKRDDDLSDDENPFRKEYQARYDYVITHFKSERGLFQELTRRDVFLLLGKPTEMSNRIDYGLMGPGYRNAFHQHEPEFWVFEDPGFGYQRAKLKIQFVPTSSFGDFVGVTDRLSGHWLRQLKFKLIYNPDLEHAPVQASSEDFQVVELSREKSEGTFFDEEDTEPQALTVPPTTTASVPPEKAVTLPQADPQPEPVAAIEEQGEALAVPSPVADESDRVVIPATELNVPSKTTVLVSEDAEFAFNENVGNSLALSARIAHFKSGTERALVLGRIGFPLQNLAFTNAGGSYLAPFLMNYELIDSSGKTVLADSIRHQMRIPNKRAIERSDVYFSEVLAILLPGDRYRLRVQVEDTNAGQSSYLQQEIEIPQIDTTTTYASSLVLMDPNVNPDRAKFSVQGTPFHLRMTAAIRPGERLYPVVEVVNLPADEELDNISIQALKHGEVVHRWPLYDEEITDTFQNSLLLHPVLNTSALANGAYRLRFEMKLTGGELLLAETPFEITP